MEEGDEEVERKMGEVRESESEVVSDYELRVLLK